MTASPSKTPAIKLRRRFTLSVVSTKGPAGAAMPGAIARWHHPRTPALCAEITLAPIRRNSTHLASDLRRYTKSIATRLGNVRPFHPVTTVYVSRPLNRRAAHRG